MSEEFDCNDCQYYERVDGEMLCVCSLEVWEEEDSIPCKLEHCK